MKTLFAAASALTALTALPALAAAAPAACLAEANPPELAPDAQTVALLTCDALRARGADVGPPTDAPSDGAKDGPAWRVGLLRLGDAYLVRLSRQGVAGQPDATETLRLDRLGDIEKAAPRLAEAMTGGRPLAQSQEMETVTHAEAHTMEKKAGDFLYGIGIYGMAFTGLDAIGAFGFQGAVAYETPEFGAHGALRIGGAGGAGDDSGASFELSVGGRYFFSQTDSSLFVGAGLSGLAMIADNEDSLYDGAGLGAYGEIGYEFLRLYGSRLAIEARISAPFFELERAEFYDIAFDDDGPRPNIPNEVYVMPITLGLSYMW